jgi:energy-converting hydrogenase A subunit R
MSRLFATDCEGPISKNDNAQELAAHFVPQGEYFFAIVSKYDDFLADVIEKPGYKAGDTLKLILPFLAAFGANNEAIRAYSRSHIVLVHGASETLRFVQDRMASFIISTSYEPYMQALCDAVDFPVDHVFCTRLDMDRYSLESGEKSWLRKTAADIAQMEMLAWHEDTQSAADLPKTHGQTLKRLDRIFWEDIPTMKIGRVLEEIVPVGGAEKARSVLKSLEGTGLGLKDVIYVGDSITDVQALDLVRKQGGLAISFNGNRYAIRSSEVCCMSNDSRVIAILADAFNREGRDGALHLVSSWPSPDAQGFSIDPSLVNWLNALSPADFPRIEMVTDANRMDLTRASEDFRKQVRGVEIGALG